MDRGKLIVLEGIDGAGTTTQTELLTRWMSEQGLACQATREPSSGMIGTMLRDVLRGGSTVTPAVVALLFAADRADHCAQTIVPRLAKGTHIVSDRGVYSSLAYQGVEFDHAWIESLNRWATEPDLVIYLRVSPDVAAQRRSQRAEQRELFDADEIQRRVAQRYDMMFGVTAPNTAVAASTRHPNVAVIDGERPVDEVQRAIRSLELLSSLRPLSRKENA